MAKHRSGWAKVHRKILESYKGDGIALAIFITLVLEANYVEGKTPLRKQRVKIRRGQVTTSSHTLSAQTGFARRTIDRKLQAMQNDGTLTQNVTSAGRIITLVNYDTYQCDDDDVAQPVTRKCATRDPQVTHKRAHQKEGKKGRREEVTSNPPTPRRGAVALGERLLKRQATAVLNKVIGAMRSGKDAARARAAIGEAGWKALMVRYPSWESCCSAYAATLGKSSLSIAEGQFREQIAAALAEQAPLPQ